MATGEFLSISNIIVIGFVFPVVYVFAYIANAKRYFFSVRYNYISVTWNSYYGLTVADNTEWAVTISLFFLWLFSCYRSWISKTGFLFWIYFFDHSCYNKAACSVDSCKTTTRFDISFILLITLTWVLNFCLKSTITVYDCSSCYIHFIT